MNEIKTKKSKGGRPKNSFNRTDILNKDLYEIFVKKYPNSKIKDYSEFYRIIREHLKLIQSILLENTGGFKIPQRIGRLIVCGYLGNNKIVDWKETNRINNSSNFEKGKVKKLIYHVSKAKDGRLYKLYLMKNKDYDTRVTHSFLSHKTIWKWETCRELKKKISDQTNNDNYHQWFDMENVMVGDRVSPKFLEKLDKRREQNNE